MTWFGEHAANFWCAVWMKKKTSKNYSWKTVASMHSLILIISTLIFSASSQNCCVWRTTVSNANSINGLYILQNTTNNTAPYYKKIISDTCALDNFLYYNGSGQWIIGQSLDSSIISNCDANKSNLTFLKCNSSVYDSDFQIYCISINTSTSTESYIFHQNCWICEDKSDAKKLFSVLDDETIASPKFVWITPNMDDLLNITCVSNISTNNMADSSDETTWTSSTIYPLVSPPTATVKPSINHTSNPSTHDSNPKKKDPNSLEL